MITLNRLCSRVGGDLVAVSGTMSGPGASVTGVHVSELADPTPYLSGGELLLTTGIPLAADDAGLHGYVRRLADHGVTALGVGLGAGVDELPAALAPACASLKLPLLVVPDGVPFQNVSRGYWDLVLRRDHQDFAANLGTQAALARAATLPNATETLVRMLADVVDGWVVHLPADDGPATAWPPDAAPVRGLRAESGRLNMGGAPSAATFELDGRDVVEYPITVGSRVAGFLAVGAGPRLTAANRHIVLTVCVLLSLRARQDRESSRVGATLRASAVRLVLAGHTDSARLLARDLDLPDLPDLIRLLVVHDRDDPEAEVTADRLRRAFGGAEQPDWAPTVDGCRLCARHGGATYFLLDADARPTPAAAAGEARLMVAEAATADGTAAGTTVAGAYAGAISAAVPVDRVSDVVGETARAATEARRGSIVVAGAAAQGEAESWVRLLGRDPRDGLLVTVRAYLRHHGHWERAARDLRVHRNSVRHRIGAASRLLGVDFDDPDVAAMLWLALRAEETLGHRRMPNET